MKWFGKKAGRGSARPALTRGFGMAFGTGKWPRSYEAQVRDAYALNPIAQRAVRLVAESIGSAPITCSEPEVARLIAAQSGGQGLIETVASHLLLHGRLRRAWTASGWRLLRPVRVRRPAMRCGAWQRPRQSAGFRPRDSALSIQANPVT